MNIHKKSKKSTALRAIQKIVNYNQIIDYNLSKNDLNSQKVNNLEKKFFINVTNSQILK